MQEKFLIVWCTCPDEHSANTISRHLVDIRLAACVTQLAGARSVYRWKGKLETTTEILLMVKTTAAAYDELAAAIEALHPNDVPEILATPVTAGAEGYLSWVSESIQ